MSNCTYLVSCYGKLDCTNLISLYGLFSGCVALNYVETDDWDTSTITNMELLFRFCNALTTVNVSNWDVSKVTRFGHPSNPQGGMFYSCPNLVSLDLSNWVFSQTDDINFRDVFGNCNKLTTIGDVSGWNTTKFTTVENAFQNCYVLSQSCASTMSGWDVQNVLSFQNTFNSCIALTDLSFVSNWNVTKVTNFLEYVSIMY